MKPMSQFRASMDSSTGMSYLLNFNQKKYNKKQFLGGEPYINDSDSPS